MEANIMFEEIKFLKREHAVRGLFLGRYYFDIPNEQLERIAPFSISNGQIVFNNVDQPHAEKRFQPILDKAFTNLYHINYNKPTAYIHKNSGIPLIGTNEFGIVDRGSNIIELKPLTGCNLQCPYCSVDEGKNDKTHDYIVELDYLLEESAKVAATKKHPVEFHIGPQGEPMLYPKFTELVKGLKDIPQCQVVTVVTNGSLLTEKKIDELTEAGLDKINLSLNAISQETADVMSGRNYPVEHVLKMVKYCQGKINVILAPTIVPGYNDEEIEGLVQLGTTIKSNYPAVSFQNFLNYKRGRNPAKQRSFDEFFEMLKPHESSSGLKLTEFSKEDFHIYDEDELEKPFRKRDILKARVMAPARFRGEIIAVAKERCITVVGPHAEELPLGKDVKIRILRDKHNIFKAVLL